MSQSRAMSLVEAATNVAVGWATALALQVLTFPAVGIQVGIRQHLLLSLAFTAVSLLRSYALRRVFAGWSG